MLTNYINVKVSLQDWNFPFPLYSFSVDDTPSAQTDGNHLSLHPVPHLAGIIWFRLDSCTLMFDLQL